MLLALHVASLPRQEKLGSRQNATLFTPLTLACVFLLMVVVVVVVMVVVVVLIKFIIPCDSEGIDTPGN